MKRLIERWAIIKQCLRHRLPEPIFEETTESLVVTLRKYRISEKEQEKLNERQRKAIEHLKSHKKISRSEYVKLTGCSEKTAFRDLQQLTKNKTVARKGKGKKTHYKLA